MKLTTTLVTASMLLGMAAPALAFDGYHEFKHEVRENDRHVRRAIERDERAYRDGYGVVVSPGYYSSYYGQPYYGDYYYGIRHRGMVHGIVDSILR